MKKETELVHIPANKMASLKKPIPDIELYLRKPYRISLSLKDLDLSSDLEIPKGTNPIQIKEKNNED